MPQSNTVPLSMRWLTGDILLRMIIAMALLIIGYLIVLTLDMKDVYVIANTLGPVALIFITATGAYKTVRKSPLVIWTPYLVFLAQSALFFGIGPLVYIFGNTATLNYLSDMVYALDEYELLMTNLLNATGIATVMSGIYLFSHFRWFVRMENKHKSSRKSQLTIESVAVLFLVTGGLLKYLLILPARYGIIDVTIPGVVLSISMLFELGLGVVGYLAVIKGGYWKFLFWILVPINASVALLDFSKNTMITSLLLPALGAYIAHKKIRQLLVWIVFMAILFYVMQPFIHQARYEIYSDSGNITEASFSRRFEIFKKVVVGVEYSQITGETTVQEGWARLAYSGPQAAAMRLYDAGISSHILEQAWVVFIPRFLWPGKPSISPGDKFNRLFVNNYSATYVAITIYGDAYWHYGWPGVVSLCLLIGGFFALLSMKSLQWLQSLNLVYFPLIFLAMQIGMLGPSKFIQNGIIGGIPIYLVYVLTVNVFLVIGRKARK